MTFEIDPNERLWPSLSIIQVGLKSQSWPLLDDFVWSSLCLASCLSPTGLSRKYRLPPHVSSFFHIQWATHSKRTNYIQSQPSNCSNLRTSLVLLCLPSKVSPTQRDKTGGHMVFASEQAKVCYCYSTGDFIMSRLAAKMKRIEKGTNSTRLHAAWLPSPLCHIVLPLENRGAIWKLRLGTCSAALGSFTLGSSEHLKTGEGAPGAPGGPAAQGHV